MDGSALCEKALCDANELVTCFLLLTEIPISLLLQSLHFWCGMAGPLMPGRTGHWISTGCIAYEMERTNGRIAFLAK